MDEPALRTLASAPTVRSTVMSVPSSDDEDPLPDHLPRLGDGAYRGKAIVHWTLTTRDRGAGWLNARFTMRFRWLVLHGGARYAIACPVHCLMPDHIHLLLHGWSSQGDQRRFMRFLRKHTNELLGRADTAGNRKPMTMCFALTKVTAMRMKGWCITSRRIPCGRDWRKTLLTGPIPVR